MGNGSGSGSGAGVSRETMPSSPPGFGPAAAGRRPSSTHAAGTKSATRTDMLVDVAIEDGYNNLEVLRHVGNKNGSPPKGRKRKFAVDDTFSLQNKNGSPAKGRKRKFAVDGTFSLQNKNGSPAKGRKRKFVVDATKGESPGVNAIKTGRHPSYCRKGKGPGKYAKLEDNKGATGLGRDLTPIGLFEDECIFCHSFRTSEPCHGLMVLYHNGRIVSSDEGNPTKSMYVHERCMIWAPRVESSGDTFKNVEKEIQRASRLKCSRCKLRGAALGCYRRGCANTYHVPCAMVIPECRWDTEHRHVWCPKHAPCDEMSSPKMESDILSPVLQNQCPAKEISLDCQMEDNQINPLPGDEMSSPIIESDITFLQNQCPAKEIPVNKQINPLITSNSSLSGQVPDQYLVKKGISTLHRREDLQVDQLNTSSSSLPQGQCLDKEGISANYRREELANQSSTPVDQWVLLGLALSASEKDSLKQFVSLTSSTLAEEWDRHVTHVIVGRSAGSTCGRSYEVLMAILSGKWVVAAGWVVDCLMEPILGAKTCLAKPIPGPETSYEVKFYDASRKSIDGPRKGRARAAEGAPKLFSGLHFCLSACMHPEDRDNIQNLIAAGEGQLLEGVSPDSLHEILNKNPAKVYFIYDGSPPREVTSDFYLTLEKEMQESVAYAQSGAQVISHLSLFDAILSYDARIL